MGSHWRILNNEVTWCNSCFRKIALAAMPLFCRGGNQEEDPSAGCGRNPGERARRLQTLWWSRKCLDDGCISKTQSARFMKGVSVGCEGKSGDKNDPRSSPSTSVRIRPYRTIWLQKPTIEVGQYAKSSSLKLLEREQKSGGLSEEGIPFCRKDDQLHHRVPSLRPIV